MDSEHIITDRPSEFGTFEVDTASMNSNGYRNRSTTGSSLTTSVSQDSLTGSLSSTASDRERVLDDATLFQACVFIEDALQYRSIHHKIDERILKLYRIYYSKPVQWCLYIVIFLIHVLAFFESPSSLTTSWTADLRNSGRRLRAPCGLMESIELVCLLLLLTDVTIKGYLIGRQRTLQSKWLIAYVLVVVVSLLDWFVTVGSGCTEVVRFRRMLRPFFLLQNSTLMKKTVNCLRRTVPEVATVLLMLAMHLYFFTLLGMLLFPKPLPSSNIASANRTNGTLGATIKAVHEESMYFTTLGDAFMSLLVLLTTANNPDVTLPAYSSNRFYALFFIVFLVIGLYCLMNMLTAIIYNQFKGIFQNSMQSSLFRKRVGIRAAFEVLRKRKTYFRNSSSLNTYSHGVPVAVLKRVTEQCKFTELEKKIVKRELDSRTGSMLSAHQFQDIFLIFERNYKIVQKPPIIWAQNACLETLQKCVSHRVFTYFGNLVAIVNVLCITVELGMHFENVSTTKNSSLAALNLVFIFYYLLEQNLKLWALGWNLYIWERGNVFDGILTIILVTIQIIFLSVFGLPYIGSDASETVISLWDAVRIINIIIMVRLLRIITQIKTMSLVISTLFDLVRNLRAFAGILVVIFYSFAILGIELFQGSIKYNYNETNSSDYKCGTYEQLEYWANNFDDFAAALVVLWDVMVVNNWMVFLDAYSRHTGTKWSQLYFICWWLLSVVISLHVFTALIIENFTMRWDRHQEGRDRLDSEIVSLNPLTVHDMFRDNLQEPAENEILLELRNHEHLNLDSVPNSPFETPLNRS